MYAGHQRDDRERWGYNIIGQDRRVAQAKRPDRKHSVATVIETVRQRRSWKA